MPHTSSPAEYRRLFQDLYTALNNFWKRQRPVQPDTSMPVGGELLLQTESTLPLEQARKIVREEMSSIDAVGIFSKHWMPDSLPEQNDGFEATNHLSSPWKDSAVKQVVDALHEAMRRSRIFRPDAEEYGVYEPRNKLGTIRWISSTNEVAWSHEIFDEVPVASQRRTKLTKWNLSSLSDSELNQLWTAWTGQVASTDELRQLKAGHAIIPIKRTCGSKPKHLTFDKFNNLRLPPRDWDRLWPAPLGLIRYYHAPGVTEAERAEIATILTGWVLAVTRRFEGHSPENQANKRQEWEAALKFHVVQLLSEFCPPGVLVWDVGTREDFIQHASVLSGFGSAFVMVWSERFCKETINLFSRETRLRKTSRESLSLYKVRDVKNAEALITKLRCPSTVCAQYLREQLTPEVQQQIDSTELTGPKTRQLRAPLVDNLNRIIQSRDLYQEQRFADVLAGYSRQTRQDLQDKVPTADAKMSDVVAFNRYLLSLALPNELADLGENARASLPEEASACEEAGRLSKGSQECNMEQEVVDDIQKELEKLTEREREVYVLKYAQNFTYQQISAELDISVNVIEKLLVSSRKRLKGAKEPSRAYRQARKAQK